MLEALFRWIARRLAEILERFADPELDARLKAFNEKVVAADARAKEAEEAARLSEAAYLESVKNRAEWDRLIVESREQEKASEQRLRESQDRVKAIRDETKKLHEAIEGKSDAGKVRLDL